ncbi:MAG TPA: FAD-dependent oxidoreductase, partial [Rhodospirillaceae bacterium]|nr:FAD-dependent oxidoreductase [Rhodospirillaceae bacterium]
IPVIAANRIATPEDAERILAAGQADLVALARPLLADPAFVNKAAAGRASAIMPCIACNQACLDAIFVDRIAGCMVNPACCREQEFVAERAAAAKRIAVVGGGAAGMACAAHAAERGHRVVLFECNGALGGQLRVGGEVPDKHEFFRLIEAWQQRLREAGVEVRLKRPAELLELMAERFDSIVVASGVRPRRPSIPGADGPNVVTYEQLLTGQVEAGPRVAVLGGGRIAFDVALFLVAAAPGAEDPQLRFRRRWGFDQDGLRPPQPDSPARQVWMLKRSPEPFGKNLGKTTGWILRRELKDAGVRQIPGVEYQAIDGAGLTYRLDGADQRLDVDTIVLCIGQDPVNELFAGLSARGFDVHAVGGARDAHDLDAVRAIEEGTRLGLSL